MAGIKTGLVGFGHSGRVFHAPFLLQSPSFELAGIVQRTDGSAQKEYPQVKVFRSFNELLSDEQVALVVITTPNHLHASMTRAALRAGKHVVVEKPFTDTVEEAEELSSLALEKGLNLFVFHNRRWDGDFKTVRRICKSGVLGRVVRFEAHFDRFRPGLNAKQWKEITNPTSSLLHDLGTHLIDQVVCLFGKPESVMANLRTEREGSAKIDSFDLFLHYSNLVVSLKASCIIKEPGPRYGLHGVNGSFVKYGVDPQEPQLLAGVLTDDPRFGVDEEQYWGVLHLHKEKSRERVKTETGNYLGFYDNVAAVFSGRQTPAVPMDEVLITMEIIEAAFQSHNEKKIIEL